MASACVNIGTSPDNFPSTAATYGWLSPRISFSRDDDPFSKKSPYAAPPLDPPDAQGPAADFEFLLHEDPVAMLPADELFSDGKLVPRHVTTTSAAVTTAKACPLSPTKSWAEEEVKSPEAVRSWRRTTAAEISTSTTPDPFLFLPKVPRCSSRWKELLGLKKPYNSQNPNPNNPKTTPSHSMNPNTKSLKHFLHRSSRSNASLNSTSSYSSNSETSLDHSLSIPLLKDAAVLASAPDSESISISSRLSLSSSSSHDPHEDLPRRSLDSEKPSLHPNSNPNPFVLNRNPNLARVRQTRKNPNPNPNTNPEEPLAVSAESPRMNSSGKIVFQSLERSSSSPSSFNGNGGPRVKHRGMERSYSANVRITPVLNVPVCSLRGSSKSGSVFGLGQLFSSSSSSHGAGGKGRHCRNRSRQRIEINGTEISRKVVFN